MANSILHIKDSYYFEVPWFLWGPSEYEGVKPLPGDGGFPDWIVRLDQDYLDWQARRVCDRAGDVGLTLASYDDLKGGYHHWLHEDHANVGKPLSAYLQESGQLDAKLEEPGWAAKWNEFNAEVGKVQYYRDNATEWSGEKQDGYNDALAGKILIPQPFGTLKNLYEPASGLCVSKFMIIQVLVALILAALFIPLAKSLQRSPESGPRGRLSNLLEVFLVYMRDQVARPAIGAKEGDKFVPLLWSIFFFVLGCNLFGMIPFFGAPTSAFGCTLGMAGVTLLTGIVMGSKKFGVVGFWLNQVPSMDLPLPLAIFLKPMIWLIEVLSLGIKHGVLAIRLLANMFAGHIVLLGIMGLAFSWQGAMSDSWWIAAPIAVLGSTLFSVLELGVAFLQAYIFTFLSALFIGAAVHHH